VWTLTSYYVYPTALFVQTLSVYLTVLVAVQRYACLCRPYGATRFCQRQQVPRYVAAVAAFSAVFTLPRYFEYDAVRRTTAQTGAASVENDTTPATDDAPPPTVWQIVPTDFSKNHVYRIVYFNLNLAANAAHNLREPCVEECIELNG